MTGPDTLPPLALYVHLPWCVRKCPYCDFNSHETREIPEDDYVTALLDDLHRDAEFAQGRSISSIFIGGGTPSLFSAHAIARLIEGIDRSVSVTSDAEITLEANPGTAEQSRFSGYRTAGVNRLSLGIQSFNVAHLASLGRIHDGEDARRAIELAAHVGFRNINLDLMHGLPGQTLQEAVDDLNTALAFAPTHLSWYQLTIEPNTVFYRRPPSLPEDDTLWDIQAAGEALLAGQGYGHYEVSAFARDGYESRHNRNYWEFGDYLAIGAGAHGKVTNRTQGTIHRYRKTRLPADYLDPARDYTASLDVIESDALPFEFMMNALRLRQGVPRALFPARTGLPLSQLEPALQSARQRGLLADDPARFLATAHGWLFLNDLVECFLPDNA